MKTEVTFCDVMTEIQQVFDQKLKYDNVLIINFPPLKLPKNHLFQYYSSNIFQCLRSHGPHLHLAFLFLWFVYSISIISSWDLAHFRV